MTTSKDPDVLIWPDLTGDEIRKYSAKVLRGIRRHEPGAPVNVKLALTGLCYLIALAARDDPERTTVQQN